MAETADQFPDEITAELNSARAALRVSNAGKARVCARRAAGIAIGLRFGTLVQAGDALRRLEYLAGEPSVPDEVREAARRLVARVMERPAAPFSTDPVNDAILIIRFCCT